MGLFLNLVQAGAVVVTIFGLFFLSRKEQNTTSMYLMLSTVGCLIVNCSYLLLIGSATPQEGLLAMRVESIGNAMLYLCLHLFVIEYLKLKHIKAITLVWTMVECLNFFCFWNDKTIPLVYRNISFIYDDRMGVMHVVRELGLLQMIRSGLIAAVMLGTMFYMMFRLFCGRITVKSERNNLGRLIGAVFVIVGIMSFTMIVHYSFNISPICTSFAIVMIIHGVFKGELLSVVETGREWVVEHMQSAFVVVDPAYGYLDANTAAREMFPQLRTLHRNGRVDDALYDIFREDACMIQLDDRYYEKTIEPIFQKEEILGYGLILTDITEHQELLDEVRLAKQRAEDANHAKSAFMSNMSHEIRTPMNAIVGMTEILMRGSFGEQERGYLQNIRNSGTALLSIINDILDFSKIESNRLEIVEDDYEPMSLLHDLSMIFLNRIGEKNVELLYNIDEKLPAKLRGDALRIRQVIINLMNNAIKFTERGYVKLQIEMTEECDGEVALRFTVEDSGQGIRSEDIPKLFGAYQQVDTKKNHAKEGTGLGLSISKNLVELMGGSFSVESEYGVGSRFIFNLRQKISSEGQGAVLRKEAAERDLLVGGVFASPYLDDALHRLCRVYGVTYVPEKELETTHIDYFFTDSCGVVGASLRRHLMACGAVRTLLQNPMVSFEPETETLVITKPLYTFNFCRIINGESGAVFNHEEERFSFTAPDAKILLVDDNEMNRKVAVGLLEPFGMQIDTAVDGKDALAKIERRRYDLIFMDHMMPVMDGIEATKHLRAMEDEYYKTVPVIALTANVISEARADFEAAGMNDFVGKPIKMREITAILRRWLPAELAREQTVTADEKDCVQELPVIEGLDSAEGVRNSGSLKLFLSLLGDFYHLIDMKSDKIEKCLADGMIRDYTIEVHALKNTARLIGALELSEEFKEMEKLGNDENVDSLTKKTPGVLRHYRSYKPILKPYAVSAEGGKEAVDRETVIAQLRAMAEAVDAFDLDGVDEAMRLLDTYALAGELHDDLERLRALVADVAMESIVELTGTMIDFLSKQGE